jgi:hypothetical protein
LSAAHCATKFLLEEGERGLARAEIQRHDRSDPTDQFETFATVQEIIHPRHFFPKNDQVLVILDGQSVARPVAINRDPSVPAVDDEVIIMGWGLTDGEEDDSASPVLKQASLFVIHKQ